MAFAFFERLLKVPPTFHETEAHLCSYRASSCPSQLLEKPSLATTDFAAVLVRILQQRDKQPSFPPTMIRTIIFTAFPSELHGLGERGEGGAARGGGGGDAGLLAAREPADPVLAQRRAGGACRDQHAHISSSCTQIPGSPGAWALLHCSVLYT